MKRRLVAILILDVVGYSRMMQLDEPGTLALLKSCRSTLIDPKTDQYGGRVVKLLGDGALLEFESVVDAVAFAVEVQVGLGTRSATSSSPEPIRFRIGINIGDIIVEGDDIYGDGVNVAARLEALAEPGGICISEAVRDQIRGKFELDLVDFGRKAVKGITDPIQVFSIVIDEKAASIATPVEPGKNGRLQLLKPLTVALLIAVGAAALWQIQFSPVRLWQDTAEPSLVLPDKPSIAVLAFDNLSGEPSQSYLSDAMSEAVIDGLSLNPEIFVIARQSSFSYKDKSTPAKQIGRELGVRYILQGSVQRSEDNIRVSARLVDTIDGRQLWSQRYDRVWSDIFALQDELTAHIVASLVSYEGPLELATRASIQTKVPADLRAYDHLLLGRERFFLVAKDENSRAREHFSEAVRIDPNYSLGHAWLAWTHLVDVTFGWSSDPTPAIQLVVQHAQKAVELDPGSADAHWVLAAAYALDASRPERALAEYERALSLNPNNADLWAQYGWTLPRLGEHIEAVDAVERAMRLNPVFPDWYVQALIFALYNAGEDTRVIEAAKMIDVRHLQTHLILAGSNARLGNKPEAKRAADKVMEINPDFSLNEWRQLQPFANESDAERFLDGLRLAGLPE